MLSFICFDVGEYLTDGALMKDTEHIDDLYYQYEELKVINGD